MHTKNTSFRDTFPTWLRAELLCTFFGEKTEILLVSIMIQLSIYDIDFMEYIYLFGNGTRGNKEIKMNVLGCLYVIPEQLRYSTNSVEKKIRQACKLIA
jgi:hypothetical protein